MEATPVAVILAGDAVYGYIQQPDFTARDLGAVDGGDVTKHDGLPAIGEGDAGEHIPQASRVVTGVEEIPKGIEGLGGRGCHPCISQQPFDRGLSDVALQQLTERGPAVLGFQPQGALPRGHRVLKLQNLWSWARRFRQGFTLALALSSRER